MILEEYSDLLSAETIKNLESSLHLTAVGDTYRVGGVDGDNLYPSYSNPVLLPLARFILDYVNRV
jgi:hypothetical protein